LRSSRSWSLDPADITSGAFLILLGLFRKIAIADAVAPFVNRAFNAPEHQGWVNLTVAAVAFALEIYGDFAGYSDIAIGSARLLGIDLPVNFRQPYLSRNITEFWRTWHVSLSTWLRDYLYVPLGGNRGGPWRTYRNLMLTMLLGGLWHGASWTFVVWGGIHGALLCVHRLWQGDRRVPGEGPIGPLPRWRDAPAIAATFAAVCVGWVFFRSDSFSEAFDILRRVALLKSGAIATDALAIVVPALVITVVLDVALRRAHAADRTLVVALPAVRRGAALAGLVLAVVLFSGGTPVPFIYFQF
jgi:D-alanyl-lipoteichoic acid acyltransferase DltB (MBOAT superfamily)